MWRHTIELPCTAFGHRSREASDGASEAGRLVKSGRAVLKDTCRPPLENAHCLFLPFLQPDEASAPFFIPRSPPSQSALIELLAISVIEIY